METKISPFVSILARLILAGLFIYAGVLKAIAPHAFLNDIENYQILPHAVSVGVSLYLPYLEILCGFSLLFKRFDLGACLILSLLTLTFVAALTSAWARGLDIECGCFGSGEGRNQYGLDLVRDSALFAILGLYWAGKVQGIQTEP